MISEYGAVIRVDGDEYIYVVFMSMTGLFNVYNILYYLWSPVLMKLHCLECSKVYLSKAMHPMKNGKGSSKLCFDEINSKNSSLVTRSLILTRASLKYFTYATTCTYTTIGTYMIYITYDIDIARVRSGSISCSRLYQACIYMVNGTHI